MSAAADTAARQRALDIRTSFHVQAPAGSGKTELLVQRLLALLASVDRPEAVLAITFTRKAAGEMRARVAEALGPLRTQPIDSLEPHRRTTRDLADTLFAHATACGWVLPDTFDQLQIMTLDAVHRLLATRAPLASRLFATAEPASGPAAEALYRSAAARVLQRLTEPSPTTSALNRVLVHFDNDIGQWQRGMALLLARREQWLPLIGVLSEDDTGRLRALIEDALETFIEDQINSLAGSLSAGFRTELNAILAAVAPTLHAIDGADGLRALAAYASLPPTGIEALPAWQGLCDLLLTSTDTVRKSVNKNVGFPPDNKPLKQRMQALLTALSEERAIHDALLAVRYLPPARFTDTHWTSAVALFQLLPHLVAELQVAFAETGLTDYAEFARAGRQALASGHEVGDVALALDLSLQHILIDEMQDTSVSQYALLEQLTAGWEPNDGRTVFVVGDPMQSIYRFRQADVGRFMRLRHEGLPTVAFESLQLTRNFRSDSAIVTWCNATLGQLFAAEEDPVTGAVPFQPSVPTRGSTTAPAVEVHALVDAPESAEAERVAAIVEAELAADSGDIAVLVRARSHLDILTQVLAKRGIQHTAVEIERLIGTRVGAVLHALTRALLHDADRLSWLGVMRQPPIGLSLAELAALTRNDSSTPLRRLLHEPERRRHVAPQRLAALDRWLHAVEQVRADPRASLAERSERLWLEMDGPDWLHDNDDAEHAAAYFRALRSLVRPAELPDPVALTEQLADVRTSRFGAGSSRVQLMTMHKAKGLEFDCVILPGLGRRSRNDGSAPLSWLALDPERPEAVLLALQATRAVDDRDPHHGYVARIGRLQDANERKRLLYVACTRARHRLHLVGSTSLAGRDRRPPANSFLCDLWDSLAAHFRTAEPHGDADSLATTKALAAIRAERSGRRLQPATLPSVERAEMAPAEPLEYSWASATARIVGTVVHRWLERLAECRSLDAALAWYDRHHGYVRRDCMAAGLREAALDAATARCQRAVQMCLEDERGRWILFGPHRQSASELALSGIVAGRVRSIVIDRAFETVAGEHWIVDYKTSEHEGGGLDAFLASERERYRDQLTTYRTVYAAFAGVEPRMALYYPLLGRWVEWSVEPTLEV